MCAGPGALGRLLAVGTLAFRCGRLRLARVFVLSDQVFLCAGLGWPAGAARACAGTRSPRERPDLAGRTPGRLEGGIPATLCLVYDRRILLTNCFYVNCLLARSLL